MPCRNAALVADSDQIPVIFEIVIDRIIYSIHGLLVGRDVDKFSSRSRDYKRSIFIEQ
jgi:hypothetical protein